MSRAVDRNFYESVAWKRVRKTIWLKQACLCNRCGCPVWVKGISDYIPKEARVKGIVHHKDYLNESNINDEHYTLDEANLEGLCINCHNKEHKKTQVTKSDVMFDSVGNLIKK